MGAVAQPQAHHFQSEIAREWDEGTAPQRAHAVTVDVSHSGCMAVVGADLPLHEKCG